MIPQQTRKRRVDECFRESFVLGIDWQNCYCPRRGRLGATKRDNTFAAGFSVRISESRSLFISTKLAGPNQQNQVRDIGLFSTHFVLICTVNNNFVPRAI